MYEVTLKEIADEFQLETVCSCKMLEDILIKNPNVNRPGLQLAGYMHFFDNDRIQIIGMVEHTYLTGLSPEEWFTRLDEFFKTGFP
jgi:HPr kinase/phosphorylase